MLVLVHHSFIIITIFYLNWFYFYILVHCDVFAMKSLYFGSKYCVHRVCLSVYVLLSLNFCFMQIYNVYFIVIVLHWDIQIKNILYLTGDSSPHHEI